jgi:hypothetical protein
MKKRRIAVIAFMLVAVMALGVGYAVLNDTLSIGADLTASTGASAKEFDEDVYFSKGEGKTTDDKAKVTSVVFTDSSDTATINFDANAFSTAGDTVTLVFTITNTSTEFNPTVSVPTIHITGTDASQFDATTDWGTSAKVIDKAVGGVNGEITFELTVKLLNSAAKARSARLDITFSASYND